MTQTHVAAVPKSVENLDHTSHHKKRYMTTVIVLVCKQGTLSPL